MWETARSEIRRSKYNYRLVAEAVEIGRGGTLSLVSKERHKFNSDSKTSRGGLVRCSLAFHHCNERFATRTREKWIAFKSEFHLVNKNEYKTEDESELEPRLTPLTKIIILGGKNSGRVKIEFFVPSGLSAVEGGSVSRRKVESCSRRDQYFEPISNTKSKEDSNYSRARVGRRFDDEEKYIRHSREE